MVLELRSEGLAGRGFASAGQGMLDYLTGKRPALDAALRPGSDVIGGMAGIAGTDAKGKVVEPGLAWPIVCSSRHARHVVMSGCRTFRVAGLDRGRGRGRDTPPSHPAAYPPIPPL